MGGGGVIAMPIGFDFLVGSDIAKATAGLLPVKILFGLRTLQEVKTEMIFPPILYSVCERGAVGS